MTERSTGTGAAADELVIARVFDAPRELVFRAWTEPERLARWWGPKGFTMGVVSLDLRPGGIFLYSQRDPDGHEMWGKFVYREITPPERLVFVSSFSDEQGNTVRAPFSPDFPLEVLSTVTFVEHEGKTSLTLQGMPHAATEPERRWFEGFLGSMRQGWAGTLDQLAEYLATA
jgi:uncharacterized protein YndB with AHSA1/START domain